MVSADKDFFVKEVTSNEKNTLQLLNRAGLKIAPAVHSRRLLEKGYLVTDFIPGDRLQSKHLQPSLIRDYAQMQNALNDRSLFEPNLTPSGCKYNDRDDGFYRQALIHNFREGRQYLNELSSAYGLPIVDQLQRVADSLDASLDAIVNEYAGMPFAWLHNDFREDNILGDPQRLMDWGSSYGHGPFLIDLAAFLVDDPGSLMLFTQESDIGKSTDLLRMKRWLMAALGARFVEFICYRIALKGGNVDTRETCKAFLEYEYPVFRNLLGFRL
jgi:hypothetical protein